MHSDYRKLAANSPESITSYLILYTFQEIDINIKILGCSYRASSVRIAIRLPTDATLHFAYLFPFLPYMFRALISPSSGVSQAVFYIQPFGSCSVYVAHLRVSVDWFVVVVSL